MEYAEELTRPFPWRAATAVAAAVAALELVALVAIGAFVLFRPVHNTPTAAAATHTPVRHVAVHHRLTPLWQVTKTKPHPMLARSHVQVLVLNGNGVNGAAGREAAKLSGLGYRIAGKRDASRHDYARSMVMFVPSFAKEARRLSHDTHIGLVTPVDGLTPRMLRGVKLVVLLGN